MSFYLMKIGGSLISSAKRIMICLQEISSNGDGFLVVPGGGPMADVVRLLQQEGDLSDEAAHWMAILAMEQYAWLLSDGTGASLATEAHSISNGVSVLLPYRYLQMGDCGIMHSWDYTSDSVAALVASRLSVDFIKLTDVDGVFLDGKLMNEVDASSLVGMKSCIDQGALRIMISCGINARILNGNRSERLACQIVSGKGGTTVRGRLNYSRSSTGL
jgi:aspartokinase-like uncharacterized kinase